MRFIFVARASCEQVVESQRVFVHFLSITCACSTQESSVFSTQTAWRSRARCIQTWGGRNARPPFVFAIFLFPQKKKKKKKKKKK